MTFKNSVMLLTYKNARGGTEMGCHQLMYASSKKRYHEMKNTNKSFLK